MRTDDAIVALCLCVLASCAAPQTVVVVVQPCSAATVGPAGQSAAVPDHTHDITAPGPCSLTSIRGDGTSADCPSLGVSPFAQPYAAPEPL